MTLGATARGGRRPIPVGALLVAGLIVIGATLTRPDPAPPHARTCPGPLLPHLIDGNAGIADLLSVLVLVDVTSNTEPTARTIADRLTDRLTPLLSDGVVVQLIASGGAGDLPSRCLDGANGLRVHPLDDETVEEVSLAVAELVASELRAVPVQPNGGIESLASSSRTPARQADLVIVWSDLLSNGGGCLDASGQVADDHTAAMLALRCDARGTFDFGAVDVVWLGPDEPTGSPAHDQFSRAVRRELCRQTARCR